MDESMMSASSYLAGYGEQNPSTVFIQGTDTAGNHTQLKNWSYYKRNWRAGEDALCELISKGEHPGSDQLAADKHWFCTERPGRLLHRTPRKTG